MCVSREDAAPVQLLARALPDNESRCELPGSIESADRGSTAEGVGRWQRTWRRKTERAREEEGERLRDTEKGEREKGAEIGSRHTNGCTAAGL